MFIKLIIVYGLFILATIFSVKIRNFFSIQFSSTWFQSIRFVTILFGIVTLVLGLLKWEIDTKNPIITEETSFYIQESYDPPLSVETEHIEFDKKLFTAEKQFLWYAIYMNFIESWSPIFTKSMMPGLTHTNKLSDEEGTKITKDALDKITSPHILPPSFWYGFYLPPKSTIKFERLKMNQRDWSKISINGDIFTLNILLTVIDDIAYVKLDYIKVGFKNKLFENYYNYDKWFKTILNSAKNIQENELNNVRIGGMSGNVIIPSQ